MRVLQFKNFGGPDGLTVVERPDPCHARDEAVVRIEAASINPSDVKNVAGAMAQTTLPRVPGRDYAGVVVAGPTEWVGARVWGSGGDVGFTRDGTHAEQIVVPVNSLSHMPANLSFAEAASVGVNFLTAWYGLVEAANIQAGETLVIVGAGGGVGGAASQIARDAGAIVIGVDRTDPGPDAAIHATARQQLIGVSDLPAAVLDATGGRGADIVFDCVGGKVMFATAARCLAHRGRLIEISATGGPVVEFNVADFYHNESRLLGVDSLKRDLVQSAQVLDALRPRFEAGVFRPAPIAASYRLEEAQEAYRQVLTGGKGRIVLTPHG